MKKIAVTGGKGGTGKSTVSVLLANKYRKKGKKVVLVDCDVECPNDYLLFGRDLGSLKGRVYAQFPELDKKKCTKCGLCVEKCRSNAVFQVKNQYPQFIRELCSGCGLCWNICPEHAIRVEKVVTGKIFQQKVDKNFWLFSGQSQGVVDETGPIVSQLRSFVDQRSKHLQADVVIFDTAVGLHCGVIRALIGVDQAYAVTEPTPLGAHDLSLILKLLDELAVPAEVIINQSNLGNKKLIDSVLQEFNIPVKAEIPYSRELVELYSQGSLGEMELL
jgi:MinD superfamily P-loop ATPase